MVPLAGHFYEVRKMIIFEFFGCIRQFDRFWKAHENHTKASSAHNIKSPKILLLALFQRCVYYTFLGRGWILNQKTHEWIYDLFEQLGIMSAKD